jgi:hypothetical protein
MAPTLRSVGRFLSRKYSGYLLPTIADIPELDIQSVVSSMRMRTARRNGSQRAHHRLSDARDSQCALSRKIGQQVRDLPMQARVAARDARPTFAARGV